MSRFFLPLLVQLAFVLMISGTEIPAWRDTTPSARFLGPDRFWRCRDTLLWHLQDETGTGFRLAIDVRDMNTYLQGPRAVSMTVVGPRGEIVAHQVLEDDGVVDGNQAHHDGLPDMYGDMRYRAWHRHHSPEGIPPGRSRSPHLEAPGALPARTVTLAVPPVGPGLYRLLIVGTWDHWISVTPSRPVAAAIHPGPGPLHLHGDQLADAWLYAPANVEDIGVSISEEVAPWSWHATVADETGKEVAVVEPKGPYNYAFIRSAQPASVYRLRITGGSPGGCLHVFGVPMLLCPDEATARSMQGGMQLDEYGRTTWHEAQRQLLSWAYSLDPEELQSPKTLADPDLAVPGRVKCRLADVPALLDAQVLDRAAGNFGDFKKTGNDALDKQLGFWEPAGGVLARLVAFDHPDNPWHGDPILVRRIMLWLATQRFATQNAWFWYAASEGPKRYPEQVESLWSVGLRSNWYPLQDAQFAVVLGPVREALSWSLPPAVNAAWVQSLRCWALGRLTAQQGECTNQWAKGLEHLATIYMATRDATIKDVLDRQTEYFCTPGVLGRVNPDADTWSHRSGVGFGGLAADSGLIGGGIAAEQFGHDGEYCLETVSHLSHVNDILPNPRIVAWLNEYYLLKTHLTMPKDGIWPANPFAHTVSPSDTNFRTRYYTHKSGLGGASDQVVYGDLWAGKRNDAKPWPVFEEGSFLRTIDDRYAFLKTPSYYSILHTGPAAPWYTAWTQPRIGEGTMEWIGYGGMHYGGLGHKASKLGAISGIWVPDCGIVWSCQNHNVMYTNAIWGRRLQPVCEIWEEGVDGHIVSEAYNHPVTHLDGETRVLTRTTEFLYVPLTVERRVSFGDEVIDVAVELRASGPCELQELYEAIPVYVQGREIKLHGDDLVAIAYEKPEALTTPANSNHAPPREMWGDLHELPKVRFQAIDIVNAQGAGAAIVFDQTYDATQTQPIRYRDVAAATGGFNIVLPAQLAAGQTVRLRYRIVPHRQSLTRDQLLEHVPR